MQFRRNTLSPLGPIMGWLTIVLLGTTLGGAPSRVILVSIDGFAAYHLHNDRLELPNIRQLIQEGVWAESSQTVFPSVTHPSHTTLITGVSPREHGVIGNRMRNRLTGESFHITNLPRKESIRVPTLFDVVKKAGHRNAAFFWPETKDDLAIDYNLVEAFGEDGLADPQATRDEYLEWLRSQDVPIDLYFEWYGEELLRGAGDIILTQAAARTIAHHRPQFLALHLLATDVLQHNYGPDSYLAYGALSTADYCIGLLRQAVRQAGLDSSTTFVVTGDHGFHSVAQELNLYSFFQEAGIDERVTLHPRGWTFYVETPDSLSRQDQDSLDSVLSRIEARPEILKVVRSREYPQLGLPTYRESPYMAGQYLILPQIDYHLISDKENPAIGPRDKEAPYHSHGYLPEHPRMRTGLVLAGAGVRRGHRIGPVHHYDIAPTISYLLGVDVAGDPSRILRQALLQEESK